MSFRYSDGLVPLSRRLDRWLGIRFGKSLLAVRRQAEASVGQCLLSNPRKPAAGFGVPPSPANSRGATGAADATCGVCFAGEVVGARAAALA